MTKHIGVCVLTLILLVSFSTAAFAQEETKKEMKKDEMMKEGKKMMLKSVSCDPQCGFKVRSHDESELISITKEHAKKHHNMEMTDKQVKDMVKAETIEMKKDEMKKAEKKKEE